MFLTSLLLPNLYAVGNLTRYGFVNVVVATFHSCNFLTRDWQ